MKTRPYLLVCHAVAFPLIFAFRPTPHSNVFMNWIPCLRTKHQPLTSSSRENHLIGKNRLYLVDAIEPLPILRRIRHRPKNGKRSSGFRHLAANESTEVVSRQDSGHYYPPEWHALTTDAKTKLQNLLSWENLSKWDYDMVEIADLTRDASREQCCPLLFVGWALLCGPMAQEAMMISLVDKSNTYDVDLEDGGDEFITGRTEKTKAYHYHFEDLKINPRTICNFIREVERRYRTENPYHNNIHAADVTQTTHSLVQMMGEEYLSRIDPLTIFSLLLAAISHDVGHPGTNNLFQQNAMTEMAIRYNDVSVLENMHAAISQSLLFGEERRDEWDVFEGWTHDQKVCARRIMITSILATDISLHPAFLLELDSLIGQVRSSTEEDIDEDNAGDGKKQDESWPILSKVAESLHANDDPRIDRRKGDSSLSKLKETCERLENKIINYLLHCADISNLAKKEESAMYWSNCVRDEFFSQGDKEKELRLPVSPLCDRETVIWHDEQIGFLQFVIQPGYELLGKIIPRAKEQLLPGVDKTLEYWKQEKLRQSSGDGECLNGSKEL